MKKLSSFFQRYGGWFFLTGTLILFLSSTYLDTLPGILFLILGILLTILDPIIINLDRDQKKDNGLFFAWGLGFLSIIFFFIRHYIDVPVNKVEVGGDPFIVRLRYLFLAFFVLSYLSSMIWRLSLGLGYSAIDSVTQSLQEHKKRSLNRTVVSILTVTTLLILVNYLTFLRNPVIDLSPGYYSFGSNSRTIIKSLNRRVKVYVFLPVQQAVRNRERGFTKPELFRIAEDVRDMMEQLPLINSKIDLNFLNADLESDRLSDFGTVNNGTIILRVMKSGDTKSLKEKPYVERRVYVHSERDMNKLERELVRALIQVSSPKKIVYFTSVNGERYDFMDSTRKQHGISIFKNQLRFYNYTLKKLDQKHSWPGPIPDDADAVLIIGPTVPFGPEAQKAVTQYIKNGGKLMVAIDPSGRELFDWFLKVSIGIKYKFKNDFMTNHKNFPGIVVTNNVSKHRITENFTLTENKFLVLPSTGRFETVKSQIQKRKRIKPDKKKSKVKKKEIRGPLSGLKSRAFLHSGYMTFVDKNRNGKKDGDDKTGKFDLGIAYEKIPGKPGARVAIFSGVEWLTDRTMGYRVLHRQHMNLILASDVLFWLTESHLAGAIQPEKRKTRSIRVTDDLKFKNILLGMILFPLFTAILIGLAMYLYRTRRRFIGDQ